MMRSSAAGMAGATYESTLSVSPMCRIGEMRDCIKAVERQSLLREYEFGQRTIADPPIQLKSAPSWRCQRHLCCGANEATRSDNGYTATLGSLMLYLCDSHLDAIAKVGPTLDIRNGYVSR
ncbi:MAG: hypothetical protein ABL921_31565, partial [Pirellula sp.]